MLFGEGYGIENFRFRPDFQLSTQGSIPTYCLVLTASHEGYLVQFHLRFYYRVSHGYATTHQV
jgi:hypothetical protein